MNSGRARHLTRRAGVRAGIPANISLPKFMTPSEIQLAIKEKEENPELSWDQAITRVIVLSTYTSSPDEYFTV